MNLPAVLANFTEPHSVQHLGSLEEAIENTDRTRLTKEDVEAIFDLFERFPDDDGYGIFSWFMHAIEATGGYEANLLESVARRPGGFNVRMVVRFLNAGVTHLAGNDLVALVQTLAARTDISVRARDEAKSCFDSMEAR
ncbi:MAG: hypothetical protein IOC94_16405 [Methylocystis sp.]|nr:hypothetical protein [Methylocystis sp.]